MHMSFLRFVLHFLASLNDSHLSSVTHTPVTKPFAALFVRDFSYRFFYKTLCRRAQPVKLKKMRAKLYKVRGRAVAKGKLELIDLDVEFDGKRAFVIWDSITLGNY